MNANKQQRIEFGRRMRNVKDPAERKINRKIFKADKPFFKNVNVCGRNLKDGYRMFINDAIDGLQPAADLIRLMTSCQNDILTRSQKRNINKLTHKVEHTRPSRVSQKNIDRMAHDIPKWMKEFQEEYGSTTWEHLELPTNNSKLGPEWSYVALETGWECCAIGCQCKDICYARKMELGQGGQGICNRVWRQQAQMRNLPVATIAADMVEFVKAGNRGVRFCDTGGIPNQTMLDKVFASVDLAAKMLLAEGINPTGRFYIYATRFDLDWSGRSEFLQINASNERLHKMIPESNYFKIMDGDEEEDDDRLFCSCNCEACDYCSAGSGETIDQQGH